MEVKQQEYEAQAEMMGGSSGGSGPTSGSVRNASASASNPGPDKRVEKQRFVNPDAGDPLEGVDDDDL